MKLHKLIPALLLLGPGTVFSQMYIVDFDNSPNGQINAGDSISNQYSTWGVTFEYKQSGTSYSGLDLWAFDSSDNQDGIDDDLETPGDGSIGSGNTQSDWSNNDYKFGDSDGANNVLIIQERNNTTTPDDDAKGGIMNVIFDNAVTFNDIGILDIDDLGGNRPNSHLRFYDGTNNLINPVYTINELGNNSYQEVNFDTIGVKRLEIELGGSGAISGFKFTAEVPEPSTYGVIGALFLTGLVYFRRKRMSGINS